MQAIGGGELAPIRRIMTRLGAENYRAVFVLAGEEINLAKALAWGYKQRKSNDDIMEYLNKEYMIQYFEHIRLVSTFNMS